MAQLTKETKAEETKKQIRKEGVAPLAYWVEEQMIDIEDSGSQALVARVFKWIEKEKPRLEELRTLAYDIIHQNNYHIEWLEKAQENVTEEATAKMAVELLHRVELDRKILIAVVNPISELLDLKYLLTRLQE